MFDGFKKEKSPFFFLVLQVGLFLLILALATFLVGFGIYGVTYFWGQLSTKQKKEYAEILRRQEILREKVDIKILRAGYLARTGGMETVYVPTVFLEISNRSLQPLEALMISVYFQIDKKTFCSSHIPISLLDSRKIISVKANCIEWIGFGSVYKGLPLIKTTQPVVYEIWLTYRKIRTKFLEDTLVFQLLE